MKTKSVRFLAILAGAVLPAMAAPKPFELMLTPIGTHTNGPPYNTSAAEIVTHDPRTQRLYVVNAQGTRVDVLDIQDPTTPTKIAIIDLLPYGKVVNSVAVHKDLIAVAVEAPVKTDPGNAVFFDSDLNHLLTVQVGSLPDMIIFTPNGHYVLVANEGEPNTYNNFGSATNGPSIDPDGTVSIIDISKGLHRATVQSVGFTAYNGAVLDPSIRIFGPNASVAQDLEPEYIAISEDSKTAYVTLQENNALATIDIKRGAVTSLAGLGFKDHSLPGNGLDASDQDGTNNIANWPLHGMYLPDSIDAYKVRGQTFLVMANEGDAREWPGFAEEARVSTLTLDPAAFPNAAFLKQSNNLGRLTVSKALADPDNDGDIDVLFSQGGRSFSIRNASGEIVWDSGDQIEQLIAAVLPARFNASHSNNNRDNRSTSKGPEPEGLVLGKAFGRTLAFVGLERIGGVVVYDVSDPYEPDLLDYVNTRTFANPFNFATGGDLGPEGLAFIEEKDSPTRKPLLVVAHEISGSVVIFEIERLDKKGKP